MMRLNNRGISITELMIAAGIFTGVVLVVSQGQISVVTEVQRSNKYNVRERVVSNLLSSLRSSSKQFQAHFQNMTEEEMDSKLALGNMPLAWDENGLFNAEDCPKCRGRLGYVVTPVAGVKGIFQVSVRIYEAVGLPAQSATDYEFVFGSQ